MVAAAVEDYVKTIYSFGEWDATEVTPSALAARMGLAASTVTEMVKKLGAAGLVHHVPYGAITLTQAGRELALRIVRRHRLVETLLVTEFGYGWDEVHDEAEVLEHAISDRLLDAIDERLGRPGRDPHGDPIPSADGVIELPEAVLLSAMDAGATGRIVRISDRDPRLLRHLAAERIGVDSTIAVIGPKPFGGALEVEVDGVRHDLGDEVTAAIRVVMG